MHIIQVLHILSYEVTFGFHFHFIILTLGSFISGGCILTRPIKLAALIVLFYKRNGATKLREPHHACAGLVHHASHLVYEGGRRLAAHPRLGLAGAR